MIAMDKKQKKLPFGFPLEKVPALIIENPRNKILSKLTYNSALAFNKLWNKEGESNRFAYHLKKLEQDGFIKKTEKGYSLTRKGKEYVTYMEGKTGETWKFPVIAVTTVIFNKKENNVLMLERAKEPFRGYWGLHGGRLKFSDYILECAKDSILEETGLICHVELKGLFSSKTFEEHELSYNHQLFVVKATQPKGTLLQKTSKGRNKWVPLLRLSKLKILPNIPLLVDIAKSRKFRWIEADRFQENDLFKGLTVKKDIVL